MRMQRKWRGGVLLGLTFSLSLAGCSGGGNDPQLGNAPALSSQPAVVGLNEVVGLHGLYNGTASNGRSVWGAVVDNKYFIWYSKVGDPTTLGGGAFGTLEIDQELLTHRLLRSNDGIDFSLDERYPLAFVLVGSYLPKQNITVSMILTSGETVTITLAYQPGSGTTPGDADHGGIADPALIVGTYDSGLPPNFGLPSPTATISQDGTLDIRGYLEGLRGVFWESGSCPQTTGNVYRQYWGAIAYQTQITDGCIAPKQVYSGASVFDPATKHLYLFAVRHSPGWTTPDGFHAFIHVLTKRP